MNSSGTDAWKQHVEKLGRYNVGESIQVIPASIDFHVSYKFVTDYIMHVYIMQLINNINLQIIIIIIMEEKYYPSIIVVIITTKIIITTNFYFVINKYSLI